MTSSVTAKRSFEMPLGMHMKNASETQWKPLSVPMAADFGTIPKARGLMSQPVVVMMMSREPSPNSFMVAPVPVG